MILRTADGTVYKVHFRHFVPTKPRRIPGKGLCRAQFIHKVGFHIWTQSFCKNPKTECLLHEGDCKMPMDRCLDDSVPGPSGVITEARCSPRDIFTKVMGRRIALGRALKALGLDERTEFKLWTDYFRQVNK